MLQDKRLAQLQAATEQERHLVAQTQQLADQVFCCACHQSSTNRLAAHYRTAEDSI